MSQSGSSYLSGMEHADFSQAQTVRGKGVLESQRSRIGQQTREMFCEHCLVTQLMLAGWRQHLFISDPSFRAKSLLAAAIILIARVATPISW
jgi:hypothetical protein